MAASVGSVSIDLDAKIAKFESDIGRAARLLEKEISRAASMAERAMQRASKQISKEVEEISRKAEQLGKTMMGYFAISAVVDYAKRLAAVADEYANIQAKLKLATGGQGDLAVATEKVFSIAQKTFASFADTTALVQRTAVALKSAGRDSADSFATATRLAEVFNKTLVVSSATTTQAQAAIQQFSQAIASGRLQGDEFKSITENNSRFQVLLADALGVTTGKLKEMSSEGKLTVSTLLKVLNDTKKLDEEFAKMPLTIGRSTQLLSNAWTKFIGEGDQARGTSQSVANAIKAVAENLETIISLVVLLGVTVATVYTAKILKMGALWIASLAEQAIMTRAATAAAAEMGMTLAAANAPVSNLTKGFQLLGSAISVAAAVVVGWNIGSYLRDQFAIVRVAAEYMTGGLMAGWELIKAGAKMAWAGIQIYVIDYVNEVKNAVASTIEFAAKLASLNPMTPDSLIQKYGEWSKSIRDSMQSTEGFRVQIALANGELSKNIDSLAKNTREQVAFHSQTEATAGANTNLAGSTGKVTLEMDKLTVKGGAAARALKEQEAAASKYETAMGKLADMADRSAKEMGPLAKVEHEHQMRLRDIADAAADATAAARKMVNAKDAEEKVHAAVNKAINAETDAYKKNVTEAKKALDITNKYKQDLSTRVMTAGMSDRDAFAYDYAQKYREELEKLGPEALEAGKSIEQMTMEMQNSAGAAYEAEQSARFWRSTWESAVGDVADVFAQFATGQIKSAKDLGKALQDVFKQTFQRIIAEMIRSGIMKMFASFMNGGSGGGGGFWGTLLAGAASYAGMGSGGGSSGSGGAAAGPQQTGGFNYQAMLGGGAGGSGGGYNPMSMAANYAGSYLLGATGAGAWMTANAGMMGMAGGIGGAAAGAYYGMQQGDGGVGTAGATVAGAIAGYYAGTVAMGALIGAGGAAAAGGAATAGAASGAMGAASAVPIVGWVAAIALIVDKITGGAIFGSKYRPNELRETIKFDSEGVSAKAMLNEWKYVSQGSQFLGRIWSGGALLPSDWKDMEFRNRELKIDPEMLKALQKVFDALSKTAKAAAAKLGTEVVDMMDAAFETVTYYDRKGKVERTETIGTILGKQYKEEWEKFQVRMHAELLIATLAQLDPMASKIAEAYRKNADELMDAAQTMVQAQSDLKDGKGLLGAGDNLTSIMAWLENQRVGDEKLSDTYGRLSQAAEQYRDIMERAADAMEQLSRTGTPSDQLRVALKQINDQMAENIKGLNDAAIAAGLAGAAEIDLAKLRELAAAQINKLSTDFYSGIDAQLAQLTHLNTPAGDFASAMEAIAASMRENEKMAHMLARAQGRSGASAAELAKIYELGARQMAAAIKKLEDVGRQQARSLGYLGLETIDDYDARIEELEDKAKKAAEAVGGFGSAMGDVAQSATDAMNLLLGNLSPLNDQQKLQVALGGLSAGTATPEQVLEIGRRLYASTQQYTDLFNQVMSYGRRTAGGGGRGNSNEDKPKPLTTAEQAELVQLRHDREEKIKQQRFQEATEFANTVASLAASQGISFQEVADNIGFDLADLGKDLGLSMDDLLTYLGNIDVEQNIIPDSITSNFDRLLAALDKYWGNGTGYYQGAEPPEDGQITPEGRRARTGRNMRPASIGDPMPEGTNDREGSVRRGNVDPAIIAMDNYSRSVNAAGERNTRTIADATDRNTAAVNDMARDFREGFGNNPRGTRWNNEVMN